MVQAPEGMKVELGSHRPGLGTSTEVIGAHSDENYLGTMWDGMNVVIKQN